MECTALYLTAIMHLSDGLIRRLHIRHPRQRKQIQDPDRPTARDRDYGPSELLVAVYGLTLVLWQTTRTGVGIIIRVVRRSSRFLVPSLTAEKSNAQCGSRQNELVADLLDQIELVVCRCIPSFQLAIFL